MKQRIHMHLYAGRKIMIVAGSLTALVLLTGAFWTWTNSRIHQLFGGIINCADTEEKVVALTFDDGPAENTGRVIEILGNLNVIATFYVTGKELEEHMGEGRRLVRAGHELGNHSYSHQRMVFKSRAFIAEEIEKTNELIRNTGFSGEITFRPPYFKKFITLPRYLKKNGCQTVLCNIEPESVLGFSASPAAIRSYVAEHIVPGSILLLHIMYENRLETLESLPVLIGELKAMGYRFVGISELLEMNSQSADRAR